MLIWYDSPLNRYKLVVAEDVIKHFDPIRLKIEDYLRNRDYLVDILKQGRALATERAEKTLQEVKKRVGIDILWFSDCMENENKSNENSIC